jgi:hypothetical protein
MRAQSTHYIAVLLLVAAANLGLNTWGNDWGLPQQWHADELALKARHIIDGRELKLHSFYYGGLHFYSIAAFAYMPAYLYTLMTEPKPDRSAEPERFEQWKADRQQRAVQAARTLSAVLSTLVVLITFALGKLLFDRQVGLLAALVVAFSASAVAIAHFSTVDAAAVFWFWLCCLLAALLWRRGDLRWWILSGLVAGLAIGTKLDRVLVLVPLAVACTYADRDLLRQRWWFIALGTIGGYVVANPTLLLDPFLFIDGVTREFMLNALRTPPPDATNYGLFVHFMQEGQGVPLFVLSLAGLAYAMIALGRQETRRALLFLLATTLPPALVYLKIFLRAPYVALLYPGIAIAIGFAVTDLARGARPLAARFIYLIYGVTLCYSVLYSVTMARQFSTDARYAASAWIQEHIPAGASLGVSKLHPGLPNDRYRMVPRVWFTDDDDMAPAYQRLVNHQAYQTFRSMLLEMKRWAGVHLGLTVGAKHLSWYEWYEIKRRSGIVGNPPEPWEQGVDYAILLGAFEPKGIARLSAPDSGYRLVARFETPSWLGLNPRFEYVNPSVYVFQAKDGPPLVQPMQ